MVRRVPPITTLPADPRPAVQAVAPTRKRCSLVLMLKGMKAGDLPAAPGWDGEPRKGRETW